MTYTRTTWQNNVTAANATNMNNIEGWVEKADAALNIDTVNGKVAQLELALGTVSRISKFGSFSTISGKVTVAHGLGAVPDLVLFVWNLTSTPSAATIGCDYSTLTSTNVDVWASIGANAIGFAIKF
jgi:hypothetical protein